MAQERLSVTTNEVPQSPYGGTGEREHPVQGVYHRIEANIDGQHLYVGFVYATRETLSLAWRNEDEATFSGIDRMARMELLPLISGRQVEPTQSHINVDLTLESDPSEMHHHRIEKGVASREYLIDLHRPELITFARYDVDDYRDTPAFLYTFTAEKSHPRPLPYELGIMLPRPSRWSTPLCQWVISHHALSSQLADDRVARSLKEAIRDIDRQNIP